MRICLSFCAAIALFLGSNAYAGEASTSVLQILNQHFPRAVEEQLALSAAPAHLRENASLYIYGDHGYELVRTGSNGFTCLLNRDALFYNGIQFKPTCWDAAGTSTFVPVMLKVGELLAAGMSAADIKAAIATGFKEGRFHAPTTSGIAYMLQGDLELEAGTAAITKQTFPGHYMFYAVGATSSQLGYSRAAGLGDKSLPVVFTTGAGGEFGLSYIISAPGTHH